MSLHHQNLRCCCGPSRTRSARSKGSLRQIESFFDFFTGNAQRLLLTVMLGNIGQIHDRDLYLHVRQHNLSGFAVYRVKTVRSDSWRRTIASKARVRTGMSKGPATRRRSAMFAASVPGSSWSRKPVSSLSERRRIGCLAHWHSLPFKASYGPIGCRVWPRRQSAYANEALAHQTPANLINLNSFTVAFAYCSARGRLVIRTGRAEKCKLLRLFDNRNHKPERGSIR